MDLFPRCLPKISTFEIEVHRGSLREVIPAWRIVTIDDDSSMPDIGERLIKEAGQDPVLKRRLENHFDADAISSYQNTWQLTADGILHLRRERLW